MSEKKQKYAHDEGKKKRFMLKYQLYRKEMDELYINQEDISIE
jgi:hypothetical protein